MLFLHLSRWFPKPLLCLRLNGDAHDRAHVRAHAHDRVHAHVHVRGRDHDHGRVRVRDRDRDRDHGRVHDHVRGDGDGDGDGGVFSPSGPMDPMASRHLQKRKTSMPSRVTIMR